MYGIDLEDRRHSHRHAEWPARAAWTASVAGLLGVLLVSLLIVAERWEQTAALAEAEAQSAVVVSVDRDSPSRSER